MVLRMNMIGIGLYISVAFMTVVPGMAWAQDAGIDASAPVNALCPVTTDEPVDPRFTVQYKGLTIGLCCRKCRTKFENDPEAFIANLPDSATVQISGVGTQAGEDDHHIADDSAQPDISNADDDAGGHGDDHGDDHDHSPTAETDVSGQIQPEHDHETDHGRQRSKLITWIGKLHPPATHLPIGMLIGAALAEVGLMLTRNAFFKNVVTFCVVLAALAAPAAATLGWFNAGFVIVDSGDWVQTTHRWLGTTTAGMTVVTLLILRSTIRPDSRMKSRNLFRASLFATAGLVGATGFFGGALVYGLNHYAW
ncbi:MAG TPA: hypothetical protein ENJ00_06040 [Phycisphaerales bacterium]|nr:hypothetical protein [Phycisphaerales bacterium]